MKKFKSVQEVWSYCLFCPLCRDVVRDIGVSLHPHETLHYLSHKKKDHILELKCERIAGGRKYTTTYYIDCLRNTFTLSVEKDVPHKSEAPLPMAYYFVYMTLMANCSKCNCTYTNSADLELDLIKKTILNIGVELEGIYLLEDKSKYHLTFQHNTESILVSRIFETEEGGFVDDNKTVSFPMTHFDFSKPKKVLNRLKTLLVFS